MQFSELDKFNVVHLIYEQLCTYKHADIRLLVAGMLLPLALLLGIPFPVGLWLVGQYPQGDRHIALAWTVNSVMTVAGSVTAVAVAMVAGFTSVLLVGAGAYLVVAIFLIGVLRRG